MPRSARLAEALALPIATLVFVAITLLAAAPLLAQVPAPAAAPCAECDALARAVDAYKQVVKSIESGIASRTARMNELVTKALDGPPPTREDRDEIKRLDDELRQLDRAKEAWQGTVDEAQRQLDGCRQQCTPEAPGTRVGSRPEPAGALGSGFARRHGMDEVRAECPQCEGLAQSIRMLEQAAGEVEDAEAAARAQLAALSQQLAAASGGQTREQYAEVQALRKRVADLANAKGGLAADARRLRRALMECNSRGCNVRDGTALYFLMLTGDMIYAGGDDDKPRPEREGKALCPACQPAQQALEDIERERKEVRQKSDELTGRLNSLYGERSPIARRHYEATRQLEEANIKLLGAERVARMQELQAQIAKAEDELYRLNQLIGPLRRERAELDRRERELWNEGWAAKEALTKCNYERCTGSVEIGVVIGVGGINPFDPDNPVGKQPDGPVSPPPADSPGTLQFSSPAYSGGEGGAVAVTVVRTGGTKGAVGVTYASTAGSALSGADFAPANGTLTWADGESSAKTIAVALVDDSVAEETETFTVALAGATGGATIGSPGTATVSIADNDSPPPPQPAGNIQFSASTYSTAEGQSTVTITATRTGGTNGTVTVQYFTGPSSATSGADYQPVNGALAWENGDASPKTFTVVIVDDTAVEGPETFFVTLNSPTGGATLGAPATATVTIADNDVATGPCGQTGSAWQPNAGSSYVCSGNCDPCPSPQTVTVAGDRVTVAPFHAGGAATFTGCSATLNSDSSTLTYFGQANHRATITRTGNNTFSSNITSSGGGSCSMSCFRTGP